MSKSTIADILEVQRLIGKLDRRGKLAILRDLQKQNLEPTLKETVSGVFATPLTTRRLNASAGSYAKEAANATLEAEKEGIGA